jgi:hypothetical protein
MWAHAISFLIANATRHKNTGKTPKQYPTFIDIDRSFRQNKSMRKFKIK